MSSQHRRESGRSVVVSVAVCLVAVAAGGYGVLRLALPSLDSSGESPPRMTAPTPAATTRTGSTSPIPGSSPSTTRTGSTSPVPDSSGSTAKGSDRSGAMTPKRSDPYAGEEGRQRWVDVLVRVDHARERAWRTGRPGQLRRVWTATSTGLAADRAMLRAWTRRGLTVTGVSMVYERVSVVSRRPGRVVLRTVDHLGPVAAVRRTGTSVSRRALPQDRATRHRITLAHTSDGWRLSEVAPLP